MRQLSDLIARLFVIGYERPRFGFDFFFEGFLPGVREFNQSAYTTARHSSTACAWQVIPLDPHAGYWLTPTFECRADPARLRRIIQFNTFISRAPGSLRARHLFFPGPLAHLTPWSSSSWPPHNPIPIHIVIAHAAQNEHSSPLGLAFIRLMIPRGSGLSDLPQLNG